MTIKKYESKSIDTLSELVIDIKQHLKSHNLIKVKCTGNQLHFHYTYLHGKAEVVYMLPYNFILSVNRGVNTRCFVKEISINKLNGIEYLVIHSGFPSHGIIVKIEKE